MHGAGVDRDELEALVAQYRRVRVRHRATHAGGRLRRRLERTLVRIERRLERLLGEASAGPALRRAWLEHLWNQAPEPEEPSDRSLPLLFKGRSAAGSVVEVRRRDDGDLDVVVDGVEVERVAAENLARIGRGLVFRVGDVGFEEVHDASAASISALERFVAAPRAGLPDVHLRELLADGLVDRDLALTPRGRRTLSRRRGRL